MATLRTVHLTTSTTSAPYALNDCVGGLQSITGTSFDSSGKMELLRVNVHDRDKEAKALDIHFFSEGPTNSIIDNQQYNPTFADLKKELALISIAAADYKTHVSGATATATCDIPMINVSNTGALYMAVESKSSNLTYSSTQSLAIDLLFK